MASIRPLLSLLALALALSAARAADPIYPPGSRIGLAPPAGLATSKSFFGYEDPDHKVAVILVALPAKAYAELDRTIDAAALKRQGVTFESREPVPVATGKAFVVIGHQEVENTKVRKWLMVASSSALTALVSVQVPDTAREFYPDAAIRASLASLAIRDSVPVEEQLGLLPFKVDELAGFRVAGILPGRAVMLSDAPAESAGPPELTLEPHFLVAIAPGGPSQPSDRDTFARDLFGTIPNLRDVRVMSSEPLRMGGQQGHQILAEARDASGAFALTVAQWLRFGGGAYVQMIGIARTDAWKSAYPRFRSVRDGIEPK